ncbi:ABC-type nitrate/sulfonate/bicarbonate transport system substrate-binding protein [Haloactinopolyspora alba]|uniref:ABC-type nitrate/sulfonate/bicarbonate transport system substrate-binding protein n=1 Tax=Haloactinopolyspora alba TaxID=648780 RepID=A0A2P8E7M9_9ACTN|nr:PhnD/SsuA/transferrin family substrate-binding protein [Haloactinopolyspora alba]PSL05472.1 ABC-type nitrate/sulfonate/bicarbonate transport system substrate-binding protein [Haloactinopolyspora alba]
MSKRYLAATTGLALIMSLVAGCGSDSSESAGKPTIDIGYFPVISPVPFMQEDSELNDKYDVNWVAVEQGLPGAASALAAGRLDLVYGNSFSATIIFSQSPEQAQFIGQSFVNENVTVVRKDSGITSIDQITNRDVVASGESTASTIYFEIGLSQAGVDPNTNEYFIAGTGSGMVGALDSGDVEVAAGYVPYTADMVLKGIGEVIFDANDAIGGPAPGDGFIASTEWMSENEEAAKDVLRSQFRATDHIKNAPGEAYPVMAEFADASEEAVRYSFESGMIEFPDSYVPDTGALEKAIALADELGFAPEGVDDLPGFASGFFNTELAESVESEQ